MCVSPYIVETANGRYPVPCGKCVECLQRWSDDWRFRLFYEQRNCDTCLYLTLTYRPEDCPVAYNDEVGEWQSYVSKRELQLFLKRVRKAFPALKNNLRYFAIGEYGGDYNRAHYHLILFIKEVWLSYAQWYNLFYSCWSKGFIKLKRTEERNIKYVTKYFNKLDDSPHLVKPFKLMSKHLGLSFLTDKVVDKFLTTFQTAWPNPWANSWQKLPRYYRKKLDEYSNRSLGLKAAGLTFNDVVKLQEFKPKGLDVFFKDFCDNFDVISRKVYRDYLHECRVNNYIALPFDKVTRMQLFSMFCKQIKPIIDAQRDSKRVLDDLKVKHKYTRLPQNDYY